MSGTTPKPPRETYTLTLRAEPDDTRPPIIRLRQLLKLAKRGFRLACIGCVPASEAEANCE